MGCKKLKPYWAHSPAFFIRLILPIGEIDGLCIHAGLSCAGNTNAMTAAKKGLGVKGKTASRVDYRASRILTEFRA